MPKTGRVPASQFLEYEYVVADWRAVKLELEFAQGALETLEPGYQRTLGVGPKHNWVHGFPVFPEIFIHDKFVGGTSAYMFNWKPTEESPFSTSFSMTWRTSAAYSSGRPSRGGNGIC